MAKGKRLRLPARCVVQVITVLVQVFEEVIVILPAVFLQEFRPGFRDVHPPLGLLILQALAGGPMIGAQPRIRLLRRAVRVEGINIRAHRPRLLLPGVILDAVEDRG